MFVSFLCYWWKILGVYGLFKGGIALKSNCYTFVS